MVAPIRYLSRRIQDQKIGILQNTEEKKVLEVVGRVGIGTTIFAADYNLDVRGTANITETLTVGELLNISGNIAIGKSLYDSTSSNGSPGQVLKSTVNGVEWQDETGIGTGTNAVAAIAIRDEGTFIGVSTTLDFYDSFNLDINSGITSIRISSIDAGLFL